VHGAGNYDGQATVTSSGSTNFNPRFKGLGGVSYGWQGLGVNITGYYFSGFTECAPQGGTVSGANTGPGFCYQRATDATLASYPTHQVSESWRFDAMVSYGFKWPVGNSSVAVGVRNVFDMRPPRLYNSFLTYADPAYDLVGRFFYTRLEHKF
jgi:hypothetical protein